MAFEFTLPEIGEGIVEGELVKWLVKPGDEVADNQPLVEVMTDKATVEIPSPTSGKLLKTHAREGQIVKVHALLAEIEQKGGAQGKPPEAAAPSAPANKTVVPEPVSEPPAPRRAAPAASEDVTVRPKTVEAASAPAQKVLAAPATRRLARELGLEISKIEGSGPSGRITADDVRRTFESGKPVPAAPAALVPVPAPPPPVLTAPAGVEERIPIRGLRKRIWENMARAHALSAPFTFVEECDATALVELRDRFNARLSDGEPKLTYLPFIIKAVVASLRRHPALNGHVDEQAMEFVLRRDFQIGIAVATDRGLIVPVVRHADRRSLLDLSTEIRRLSELARDARISMDDLGGSTFTITSLGKDGGIFATPIINHPEVAILGVHKMVQRPVVADGKIAVRWMMNFSLSFDHRLIDGHVGAAFAYSVIRLLENPDRLIMEMA